jgi:hypothetical protein
MDNLYAMHLNWVNLFTILMNNLKFQFLISSLFGISKICFKYYFVDSKGKFFSEKKTTGKENFETYYESD